MNPNSASHGEVPLRPTIIEEELSYAIVGSFYDVYNELGYGFLESPYSRALEVALVEKGFLVQREVPVTVVFRGVEVGQHRIDMLVERRVILEIKSTERLSDVPRRQLRNYLAAMHLKLGIVLHFGPNAQYYRVLAGNHPNSR